MDLGNARVIQRVAELGVAHGDAQPGEFDRQGGEPRPVVRRQAFSVEPDATYTMGNPLREGGNAIVSVQFAGQDEPMEFVVVKGDSGWRVSLGYTITRGMTRNVQREMEKLGDGASEAEMIEAMRQGMNPRPGGR